MLLVEQYLQPDTRVLHLVVLLPQVVKVALLLERVLTRQDMVVRLLVEVQNRLHHRLRLLVISQKLLVNHHQLSVLWLKLKASQVLLWERIRKLQEVTLVRLVLVRVRLVTKQLQ